MAGYNLYAVHARGLSMLQNKFGTNVPTFLWNRGNAILFNGSDSVWPCSPSTTTTKEHLTAGGFQQDRSVRFTALVGQFYTQTVTTPEQVKAQLDNSPIGYLTARYKVMTVEIDANGLVLSIEANALDQDA